MILLLAACSSRTNVRDGDDYIYCLNPDKTGLVKVSYEVQGEDVVEEARMVYSMDLYPQITPDHFRL